VPGSQHDDFKKSANETSKGGGKMERGCSGSDYTYKGAIQKRLLL
jgi:hypothetical protein